MIKVWGNNIFHSLLNLMLRLSTLMNICMMRMNGSCLNWVRALILFELKVFMKIWSFSRSR